MCVYVLVRCNAVCGYRGYMKKKKKEKKERLKRVRSHVYLCFNVFSEERRRKVNQNRNYDSFSGYF